MALVDYLLDAEVHTYAFSVAANAIISFIPLVVLLYTIALSVFHSQEMVNVVNKIVEQFLPTTARQGNEDFLTYWLKDGRDHVVASRSPGPLAGDDPGLLHRNFSAARGGVEPGVGRDQEPQLSPKSGGGFWACHPDGVSGHGQRFLSTWQRQLLGFVFFHHTENFVFEGISYLWLAATTGLASILFFFSIYWLLPNRKIPARQVIRTSIITGIIWLAAKEGYVAVLPHLDLKALYGPFYVSVGLLFWAYISGLILFAGAQFSAVPPLEQDGKGMRARVSDWVCVRRIALPS